jgi:O-antigen/teichoic acid export membrane protein
MASVRRAVVFSLGQRYLAFVLQLGTSIILARLLTPEETGIFSMAAAAVAMGHLIREFGTGEYIISERNLTREKLRAAYAITLLTAGVVATALLALAAPLAAAYKEPGVKQVMYLLSVNYALLPLGSAGLALLNKEMAFDKLFFVHGAAGLVGALVTVAAAMSGQSYLSPAMGSIASIAVTLVMLCLYVPQGVFLMPTTRGMRSILRFGGTLTVARIVDQGAHRSVDFIVSALLGFHASGLLSKANSLLSGFHDFFSSALTRVATPALMKSIASPQALQRAYVDGIVLISFVQWMFFGLLALYGGEVIEILFGANWLGAVPAMQLGAISGALWAPFTLYASLLTARREVGWQLRIQLISAPVLVLCLWLGAQHSLAGVAALTVLATAVRLSVIGRALWVVCGISTAAVLRALGPTALATGVGLAASLGCRALMLHHQWGPGLRLVAGLAVGTALALAAATAVQHPMVREIRRLATSLRARPT